MHKNLVVLSQSVIVGVQFQNNAQPVFAVEIMTYQVTYLQHLPFVIVATQFVYLFPLVLSQKQNTNSKAK